MLLNIIERTWGQPPSLRPPFFMEFDCQKYTARVYDWLIVHLPEVALAFIFLLVGLWVIHKLGMWLKASLVGIPALETGKFAVKVKLWVTANDFEDIKFRGQEGIMNELKTNGIKFPGMTGAIYG